MSLEQQTAWIVTTLIAVSSLASLHLTSTYLDKKDLKRARQLHHEELSERRELIQQSSSTSNILSSDDNKNSLDVSQQNYELQSAIRSHSPTFISATCTCIFLVVLVILARSSTLIGNVFIFVCIVFVSSFQFSAAYRSNKRETRRKSREWREEAEENRNVLLRGLSPLSMEPAKEISHSAGSMGESSTKTTKQVELPRWVSYPDVEKVTWLNILLRRWWPYLKANIADAIQKALQPLLDEQKPDFISYLGFERRKVRDRNGNEKNRVSLDFGTSPLKIVGIKTYDQAGEDSIVIDIGLSLHTVDSNIIFEVGVGGVPFKIALHDLGFSARLRVELLHLTTNPDVGAPGGIGALQLSFTQRPDISFELSSPQMGSLGFTDIPGVHSFLTSFLKETLAASMVIPRCVAIPMTDMDEAVIRDLSTKPPNGIVVVRVIGARNLGHAKWYTNLTSLVLERHAPPSICSHYIKLKLGEQERSTACVQYTTSPSFDETFTMIVHSRDSHRLKFNVMAKRLSAADNIVGNASMSLQSLQSCRLSKETCPLEKLTNDFVEMDRSGACVDFHVMWMPVIPRVPSTPSGIMTVELIAAHNLKGVNALGGKSDPYLKLVVPGNEPRVSTTKNNTLNPKWEPPERFDFIVCNSATSQLQLELLDQDNMLVEAGRSLTGGHGAKLLGRASINVAEVARSIDPIDKTFELIDGQGRVEIRLWWYSTGDAIRLN